MIDDLTRKVLDIKRNRKIGNIIAGRLEICPDENRERLGGGLIEWVSETTSEEYQNKRVGLGLYTAMPNIFVKRTGIKLLGANVLRTLKKSPVIRWGA